MPKTEIESTVNSAIVNIRTFALGCEPFKPTPIALTLLTNTTQPLIVLGAKDAEMDAIEALCVAGKVSHVHAHVKDTKTHEPRRIRPGERIAEDNDATRDSYSSGKTPRDFTAYAVEVGGGPELWGCAEIDHHFNHLAKAPPTSAFEASSLGQFLAMLLKHYDSRDVSKLLGIDGMCDLKRIPIALRIEGAADHNLGATLRGDVPGIDRQIAAAYILRTRAVIYLPGASWDQVLEVFAECSRTLLSAPLHKNWEKDMPIRDLTGQLTAECYDRPAFNGEAYPLALRLLPVVASFWNQSYAARIKTAHGWGLRIGGGGPNLANAVSRLKDPEFAQSLGLKVGAPAPQNVYAFSERGIGGGTFDE